jgi:uridine kinase
MLNELYFLGLCGGSASGKTTVARRIIGNCKSNYHTIMVTTVPWIYKAICHDHQYYYIHVLLEIVPFSNDNSTYFVE